MNKDLLGYLFGSFGLALLVTIDWKIALGFFLLLTGFWLNMILEP